ncbi:MAG TPA: radical SAM protein [Spirochaetia bacterium]|nr:radical SAM protein [Spirochaetia bacterium]
MIKRISLIEPKNDHLHIYSRYQLPRLGGILLATIMKERGFEAEALFMDVKSVQARRMKPDLVGISTITPTARGAYALGDWFRSQGVPVVYGGPHASFLPEEALEHGDYCIVGEGEAGFPLLVDALNRNGSLSDVPGLVWKENRAIRRNPPSAPVEDLDTLPFPDFSLLDMGSRTKMGIQGPGRSTIPMQTSRGCPFDCTFCSVTGMFGKRYRHRSTQNIIAELSQYDPREQIIFFYDDNFAANRRKTKELLREMIRLNLGFEWSTQVRSDIAKDPELLDLMAQAGCTSLYIGFESVDPEALREMKKSQSVEDIRHAIREVRRRNIHVHGMFVFGFDSDTPRSARATVSFAIAEKVDSTQFMILTPLPGSGFYSRMLAEGRLFDTAWDTYDAHHVKFMPRGFTPWELQWAQIEAHTRFYSTPRVFGRLLRGHIGGFLVGLYAHALNRRWQREERQYLRWLRMLRPAPSPA